MHWAGHKSIAWRPDRKLVRTSLWEAGVGAKRGTYARDTPAAEIHWLPVHVPPALTNWQIIQANEPLAYVCREVFAFPLFTPHGAEHMLRNDFYVIRRPLQDKL